jgi:hypothetical protein
VASKVGDGRCAFQIAIPRALFDGKEHEITARVAGSAFELAGSPKVRNANSGQYHAIFVGIEGSSLKARVGGGAASDTRVLLWEGTQEIASVPLAEGAADLEVAFPLPANLLDGRPHWFRLTLDFPDLVLAQDVLVAPMVATPEDALQRYAASFPGHLSATAALRYESLRRQVEASSPALHQLHEQVLKGFQSGVKNPPPIAFPAVEKPRVSVVIPVHNKFAVTYNCLASLLLACNKASRSWSAASTCCATARRSGSCIAATQGRLQRAASTWSCLTTTPK